MLSRFTQSLLKVFKKPKAKILHKHQHNIQLTSISRHALNVVQDLQSKGFQAFLVGGCVRDLLIGVKPKDFDVATNATPEQVRNCLHNAFIIGRRFRLVHVNRGAEIIEVATFRAKSQAKFSNNNHRILFDNAYGSLEEDAMRRDFTINSLFFDPKTRNIFDFAGGAEDLTQKQIRLIGNPKIRYLEDPVRMLRAVRFVVKLNFTLEPKTEGAIAQVAPKLQDIPPARLFDELNKILCSGYSLPMYELLSKYNLWQQMFGSPAKYNDDLLKLALGKLDKNKISIELVFAALFWYWAQNYAQQVEHDKPPINALSSAINYISRQQYKTVAIPREFTVCVRYIFILQERLKVRLKRNAKIVQDPNFDLALEFLKLRGLIDVQAHNLWSWWHDFKKADTATQNNMIRELRLIEVKQNTGKSPKKRKKRKIKPQDKNATAENIANVAVTN